MYPADACVHGVCQILILTLYHAKAITKNTLIYQLYSAGSTAKQQREQFLRDAILLLQNHLVSDWFNFGLHLHIEIDELNVLEVNSLSFPDKRTSVRQLLTKWKDTFDAEATWEKIVIALRKIGNIALAQEVEEQYVMSERH